MRSLNSKNKINKEIEEQIKTFMNKGGEIKQIACGEMSENPAVMTINQSISRLFIKSKARNQ